MLSWIRGKKILVTGGTGSIGSEIVRQLLPHEPQVVRVFSRDETKQMYLAQELSSFADVRYLIGDVRDKERLHRAAEDIDVIIHAAAMKHVPACEYNPFEAVKTNVLGVQNALDAALAVEAEQFVFISTDKVVNPVNAMGATKLLGERLVAAAHQYRGHRRTRFTAVRFGNVLGSRGSVIPLFKAQIAAGGPVTITHPGATRFIMSIDQAVRLTLEAMTRSTGGELFILKMPVINIADLAQVLMEEYGPRVGRHPDSIPVEEIGLRPGEKLFEELLTEIEAQRALENGDLFMIPWEGNRDELLALGWQPTARRRYTSEDEDPMGLVEIRDILHRHGLLNPDPVTEAVFV